MAKQTKKSKKQKKVRTPRAANPNGLAYRAGNTLGRAIAWCLAALIIAALLAGTLWLLGVPNWAELINRFHIQVSIEYIKALAWPVVVVIALIVLRKELVGLLHRITKVSGPGGLSAEMTPPQAATSDPSLTAEPATAVASEPEADAIEGAVDTEALYQNPTYQLHFEKTYRSIFGTQIELLYLLSGAPDGYGEDTLSVYLNRHNQRRIGEPINFTDYMSYLISNILVLRNANGIYQLTIAGQLFLRYIVDQGVGDPTRKPL